MQKEVMVAGMQLMERLNVVDQWKQRVWEILTEYNEEYFKILNLEGAAYNGEKIRIGRGEGRATHSYHFFDLMVILSNYWRRRQKSVRRITSSHCFQRG